MIDLDLPTGPDEIKKENKPPKSEMMFRNIYKDQEYFTYDEVLKLLQLYIMELNIYERTK